MPNRFLHQAADQGSDPSGRCTGEHRPWLCLPAGRRARRAPKEMLFVKKYSMSPSEKQTRNSHSVKRQEVGEGGRLRREERREPLLCGTAEHTSKHLQDDTLESRAGSTLQTPSNCVGTSGICIHWRSMFSLALIPPAGKHPPSLSGR